jgi:hypothetical protein
MFKFLDSKLRFYTWSPNTQTFNERYVTTSGSIEYVQTVKLYSRNWFMYGITQLPYIGLTVCHFWSSAWNHKSLMNLKSFQEIQ